MLRAKRHSVQVPVRSACLAWPLHSIFTLSQQVFYTRQHQKMYTCPRLPCCTTSSGTAGELFFNPLAVHQIICEFKAEGEIMHLRRRRTPSWPRIKPEASFAIGQRLSPRGRQAKAGAVKNSQTHTVESEGLWLHIEKHTL